MSIIDQLLSSLAPHNCLSCQQEGALLCVPCLNGLPRSPERCYRCQQQSALHLTCQACRGASDLRAVYTATTYEDEAKALLWQLKFAGAQATARVMARHMTTVLPKHLPRGTALVPVPTASSRRRQRGYDQAELLARELGHRLRLPVRKLLARHGQTSQHGHNRQQRLLQLQEAFHVTRMVHTEHILLIDDVMTTGATLEAAAQVLHQVGARHLEAAVFATPVSE